MAGDLGDRDTALSSLLSEFNTEEALIKLSGFCEEKKRGGEGKGGEERI